MNHSEHTLINYHSDLKKFIGWCENQKSLPITKVEPSHITEYKDFLTLGGPLYQRQNRLIKMVMWTVSFFLPKKKKEILFKQMPLKVSSRRRHLSAVKGFFEFLKQIESNKLAKKFKSNPVKSKIHGIKLKEKDVKNTVVLEQKDWDKIDYKIHRSLDRLMVSLLYYGGLRLNELTQLKYSDFDKNSKTVKLKRKGGYLHTLKLYESKEIFRQILYLQSSEDGDEFIFSNRHGKKLTNRTMYNKIMGIFKKAGTSVELTPHSFRKACATNLYMKTMDLLYVRDYLNHNDAKVTQTYIDKKVLSKYYDKYTSTPN